MNAFIKLWQEKIDFYKFFIDWRQIHAKSVFNPLWWPYEFYEGKNSGLSIRSVYRPDKEFFFAEISFFFKILVAIWQLCSLVVIIETCYSESKCFWEPKYVVLDYFRSYATMEMGEGIWLAKEQLLFHWVITIGLKWTRIKANMI